VFSPGKKERYLLSGFYGQDPSGKHPTSRRIFTIAFRIVILHQGQDLHCSIVIMKDISLRGLPDKLTMISHFFHNIPLRRGRQGYPQTLLQPLQPVKG